MSTELWEILVPTQMPTDTGKLNPVRVRHHRLWDKYVRALSGGLTILTPVKGQWVHQEALYTERMIPVRIACNEKQIRQIIKFTLGHYRQTAVMAYRLSDKVLIVHGP